MTIKDISLWYNNLITSDGGDLPNSIHYQPQIEVKSNNKGEKGYVSIRKKR